ncbi:MAG: hypothetical protein Q9212_001530 [Teloschistes hypoglaucus]
MEEARKAGFTNVQDFRDWERREEEERCHEFEARLAEMERNGTVDPWLQKQIEDDLREVQGRYFDPEKCRCKGLPMTNVGYFDRTDSILDHINRKFCPGSLVPEPHSPTRSYGEFDRDRLQEIWAEPINVRGPSHRYEGSDVHSLWSLDSQAEENRDLMPDWAVREPLTRYLMQKAGRSPWSPHDHMFGGYHEDQDADVQMMDTADDNPADLEPLGGQPKNGKKGKKGGKGEIKSSKNRSAAAKLPTQQSQRAPAMKRGRPKKVISDTVSQWLCSSLGERKQTRSQKEKIFIALNAKSQPEVIETQPRRSQRSRRAV